MNNIFFKLLTSEIRLYSGKILFQYLCTNSFNLKSLPNLVYTNKNHFSVNLAKMAALIKPKIVFVLGAPGSGKGTQCEKIVKAFHYIHLSAGDLLREERSRKGSEYRELIENYITNGQIVPVEITCALLENAMNKYIQGSGRDKFLIDGFPRNQDNLDGWTLKMSEKVHLQFVLFFDCPESLCTERCIARGQAGSQRSDDNPDSLKKRFDTYTNASMPIIEFYRKQNLVRQIDAMSDPQTVFEKVKQAFKNLPDEVGDF